MYFYIYIFKNMDICIYIHACMYIHVHTHTHIYILDVCARSTLPARRLNYPLSRFAVGDGASHHMYFQKFVVTRMNMISLKVNQQDPPFNK